MCGKGRSGNHALIAVVAEGVDSCLLLEGAQKMSREENGLGTPDNIVLWHRPYDCVIEPPDNPEEAPFQFLIAGDDLLGRVLVRSSNFHGPITIAQPALNPPIGGSQYDRFELNYVADPQNYDYKPLCRWIKCMSCESCKSKCDKQDDTILNTLFNECQPPTELSEAACSKYEQQLREHLPDLNVTVQLWKDAWFYVRYTCPLTKYIECAIPVLFCGKYEFVVFYGQHIVKDQNDTTASQHLNDDETMGKLILGAPPSGIEHDSAEYNIVKKKLENIRQEMKRSAGIIDEEELNVRLTKLFECLGVIKKELVALLIEKVQALLREALVKAYKDFDDAYEEQEIREDNYYNASNANLQNLAMAMAKGLGSIAQVTGSDIIMYTCNQIRVLENDPIKMVAYQIFADQQLPQAYCDDHITKTAAGDWNCEEAILYASKDKESFVVHPDSLIADEYSQYFLAEYTHMLPSCHTLSEDDYREVRDTVSTELKSILSAFYKHNQARGQAVMARYHAKRLEMFTRMNRHEIAQKTQMMEQMISKYNLDNTYGQKTASNFVTKMSAASDADFIRHTLSHVRSVARMIESSRYVKGVPEPIFTWFFPYREFLYKWIYIFLDDTKSRHIDLYYAPLEGSNDTNRPAMFGDKDQIEQVIYNLTGNALKYSHSFTQVTIDFGLDASKKNYECKVTNYATPIKTEDHAKIFEFGGRGHNIYHPGDGMGLYIASRIAKMHGGSLTLNPSASELISSYNVPLLSLIERVPSEFQPGGPQNHLLPKAWWNSSKFDDAQKAWESLKGRTNLLQFVLSKPLLGLMQSGREAARSLNYSEVLNVAEEMSDLWWLGVYFQEIERPTAKIVFTLSIPSYQKGKG